MYTLLLTLQAETLQEMRLFIPEKTEEVDGTEELVRSASLFQQQVLDKADIATAGKSIVKLEQMPFLTPRYCSCAHCLSNQKWPV